MALYYLDAQDANYPYQVVRKRLSDGGYVGQMPMSASLVAFSEGKVSGTAQVTVLPMGGLGSTTIQLNDYDWASCLPEPAAYSTDAEIMAYLSTLFTGQLGARVPPTPPDPSPQSQYFYTTPCTAEVRDGIPLHIPISGGNGNTDTDQFNVAQIAFYAHIDEVYLQVISNTLDADTTFEFILGSGVKADLIINAEDTGVRTFDIYDGLIPGSLMLYRISSPSTTGEILFSIRAKLTPIV